MAHWLKRGMDAGEIKVAEANVRETVEGILAQVEDHKDAAIRELSKKFGNWGPKDFRLTPSEIGRAISQVAKRDIEDIKFAQAQSQLRAESAPGMRDVEVETLPGVVLGQAYPGE